MADPLTMAIVMAGAQVAKGVSEKRSADKQAKAVLRNTEANMTNERNALEINRNRLAAEQEKLRGRQTVAAGVSGATLGSFSNLFEDTDRLSAVDTALLEYDSKLKQENMRFTGGMQRAQLKQQGKSALLNGLMAAGGTMMGTPQAQKGMNWGASGNSTGQSIGATFSKSPSGPYLNYGSRTTSGYS